jgi:hypothetical protein
MQNARKASRREAKRCAGGGTGLQGSEMSEYQDYVSSYSTRARITPTSFINEYSCVPGTRASPR